METKRFIDLLNAKLGWLVFFRMARALCVCECV